MQVIKTGAYAPKLVEGKLVVTVRGDNHTELYSPDAKKTAWDFRFDKSCPSGFGQAGIDAVSGASTIKVGNKSEVARQFVLTPGL